MTSHRKPTSVETAADRGIRRLIGTSRLEFWSVTDIIQRANREHELLLGRYAVRPSSYARLGTRVDLRTSS